MTQKPFYITEEGLKKLKEELYELEKVQRPKVAERIKEARSHGDLSENAEYDAARDEQSFIEGQIVEIKDKLKRARIIKKRHSEVVGVGSTVEVESEGRRETFFLVGPEDADPSTGKISVESPIGKALLNHRAGEMTSVLTPAGEFVYKIIKVS